MNQQRKTRLLPNGLPSGTTAALVLLAGIVLIFLVWRLARPLALFTIAAAIAAALSPLAGRLSQRMPRTLAVILVYLVVVVLVVFIFLGIIPTIVDQLQAAVESAPDLLRNAEGLIDRWDGLPELSFFDLLGQSFTLVSTALVALPIALASAFFEIVMIFVISVYMLLEAPRISSFFIHLFPESRQERAAHVSEKMVMAMGGFVQGTIMTAGIVGVLTYLGLVVLGVQFPLVFGLLAGMLEIIPTLGPVLAAVPIVFVALLDSPTKALMVIVFIVILQQLESHVIMPNIMRSRLHISPLLIILAVLSGGALGGLVGIIAAIPLVAALSVFVEEVAAPALRSWLERREKGIPEADLPLVEDRGPGPTEIP